MPAGVGNIIISNIICIPSKNHITKTGMRLYNRKKFFRRNIFATQYAINIS